MAGHSHWKQIKHHKGAADVKRGILFSKLLAAVSAAAKQEPNPDFNPRLRTTIEKARAASVPQDNIERAITKATSGEAVAEEALFEAYGPGGTALLIETITDSTNRTVAEIKLILRENNGKWAEPGSVTWGFESRIEQGVPLWHAKFPLVITAEEQEKLTTLVAALQEQGDVQRVYTNAAEESTPPA